MRLPTWMYGVIAACCVLAVILTLGHHVSHRSASEKPISGSPSQQEAQPAPTHSTQGGTTPSVPLTIMAVGGSSAQGYYDPHLNGYLARALTTVSNTLHVPIRFVNQAKSGDIPTMLAPKYDPMVHQLHPNIVIISWGLLDSIAKKVPEKMFQATIQSEVTMALQEGADVWVVTPTVTEATYVGPEAALEPTFSQLEMSGALAVHSPRVHIFDLLGAMQHYLTQHHMSYKPYVYNAWHLNSAGHVLAGRILASMILQQAKSLGIE